MRLSTSNTPTSSVSHSIYKDESFIPLAILNYVLNPLDLIWYWNSFFLYFTPFVLCSRTWYWRDFMYHPHKLFLLRGGRVLKVESQSLGNQRYLLNLV